MPTTDSAVRPRRAARERMASERSPPTVRARARRAA
jgi:hypothetical protein